MDGMSDVLKDLRDEVAGLEVTVTVDDSEYIKAGYIDRKEVLALFNAAIAEEKASIDAHVMEIAIAAQSPAPSGSDEEVE